MGAGMMREAVLPELAIRPFGLLAFGGSAGAIPALVGILSRLPATYPIPIVVVQHLGAQAESRLPDVLGRKAALRCRWAEPGETPRAGTVLIAPPGGNLTLAADGRLAWATGAKPRLGWPSIDAFFRSAAERLGPRLIAVVLSGVRSDGSDGILAVRRSGGATIAKDIGGEGFSDMPTAAVDLGRADLTLTAERIGEAVQILAERGVE